jgi:hypothetical protein
MRSKGCIERLFGLDIHNVDHIVPELQNLAVGDVIPMRPNDPGMRVEVLEPERAMSARRKTANGCGRSCSRHTTAPPA